VAEELTDPFRGWTEPAAKGLRDARRHFSWRRAAWIFLVAIVALYAVATAGRVYARKYYVFLPDYLRWVITPAPSHAGPTHVFFLFVDHFEPNDVAAMERSPGGIISDVAAAQRVRRWGERYANLAARHQDSNGRPPQHTWFYPGEQKAPGVLAELQTLVGKGLGEVELHFHHRDDTEETLAPKIKQTIQEFQKYGFLKTRDGQTRFAFIHGNFSLDGSRGPFYCGLTKELRMLRELGCFADYTFPSVYLDAQPPWVNGIYAAKDDEQTGSYRRQFPLSALRSHDADLMIFQGPLLFAPSLKLRRLFLDLDDGAVHPGMPPASNRVDRWVRANIHVPGRPDWIFIKVFGHGISTPADEEQVLGRGFEAVLTRLEQGYNDGKRYILHYVTAREAYNLAMAAADGKTGHPRRYFDATIPPYLSDRRAAQ
jgi:hypothetical protein